MDKNNLVTMFRMAIDNNFSYVGVAVKAPACKEAEFIINPIANAESKLGYYTQAYDDNLHLKANKDIEITAVAYGDSMSDIASYLLEASYHE